MSTNRRSNALRRSHARKTVTMMNHSPAASLKMLGSLPSCLLAIEAVYPCETRVGGAAGLSSRRLSTLLFYSHSLLIPEPRTQNPYKYKGKVYRGGIKVTYKGLLRGVQP